MMMSSSSVYSLTTNVYRMYGYMMVHEYDSKITKTN